MSKQTQKLKNSKAGHSQAHAKSVKKSAEKQYEKHLEEISTPVKLSLTKENYGHPLTDFTQLVLGGFGLFAIIAAFAHIIAIIGDFLPMSEGDDPLGNYFATCTPSAACRAADISELLVILLLITTGIILLKATLTNRHPHRLTIRLTLALFVAITICYAVHFTLNQIFWN